MNRLSRRSMLGFGALAGVGGIGGVVGIAPTAATAPPAAGQAFVLHGRIMRRSGAGTGAVGEVRTVRGVVSDGGTGDGEVFHTVHVVARGGDAEDVATVESHQFVFDVGTLSGSGTVGRAGRGTFVVTEGTGRYASACGS